MAFDNEIIEENLLPGRDPVGFPPHPVPPPPPPPRDTHAENIDEQGIPDDIDDVADKRNVHGDAGTVHRPEQRGTAAVNCDKRQGGKGDFKVT